MQVCIRRGTKEIEGSCVEVLTIPGLMLNKICLFKKTEIGFRQPRTLARKLRGIFNTLLTLKILLCQCKLSNILYYLIILNYRTCT